MAVRIRQKKVSVGIVGAKKLAKTLKNMDEAAGGVLMQGAMAGGEIALADAKENCPVDTGALKESLKVKPNKATKKKSDCIVDYDKTLRYGTFVELGARGRPPNPFLRNAVDGNIDKINEAVVAAISDAIGKSL